MREKLHATHTLRASPARNRRRLRKTKQKNIVLTGPSGIGERIVVFRWFLHRCRASRTHIRRADGEVEELSLEESLKIKYVERCMRNAVFAFFIRTQSSAKTTKNRRAERRRKRKRFCFPSSSSSRCEQPFNSTAIFTSKAFLRFFFRGNRNNMWRFYFPSSSSRLNLVKLTRGVYHHIT